MRIRKPAAALIAVSSAAVTAGAACSRDTSTSETTAGAEEASTTMPSSQDTAAAAAAPIGPGCAGYTQEVPSGPGSVGQPATEPLTVAAANNPLLTTFTAAVSGRLNPQVNLTETVDGGEFTVFAPVDDAFAALDPATVETLKTDSALLTTILTYHVVPGRIGTDDIAGTFGTVEGSEVTATRDGDRITVNDSSVVCGGMGTANATVYLVDKVLIPATVNGS
ncbi:fasciclin domain-containing protein [Nocardia sp. NPDC001965]